MSQARTWMLILGEAIRAESRRPFGSAKSLRLAINAIRRRKALECFLRATRGSLLERTITARPELLLMFDAPYINCRWSARERIDRFANHIGVLERLGPSFSFALNESVEVLALEEIGSGYSLILDKPRWFMREGVVALNIFKGNVRLFSIAFAFDESAAGLSMIIGGIQGRKIDKAQEEYKALTKAAYGIRPRDLMFELVRMFATNVGTTKILAVSDACRHHRSSYFGRDVNRPLPLNYDEVWHDRAGVLCPNGFFELPLRHEPRNEADIPARKRAMYRSRYSLLNMLQRQMIERFPSLSAEVRPEAD